MNEIENEYASRTTMRGTWMQRTVGIAAAFALIVGGGVVAYSTFNDSSARPSAHGPSTNLDANVVLARSQQNAASKKDVIEHATTSAIRTPQGATTSGKSETWTDNNEGSNTRSLTYNVDGSVNADRGALSKDGTLVRHDVDYANHVATISAQALPLLGAPLPADDPQGNATLVGTESINGVKTLHFQEVNADSSVDQWIADTDELLPVRLVSKNSQYVYTVDFEFLPRTDAAVAQLLPVIPEGFAVKNG